MDNALDRGASQRRIGRRVFTCESSASPSARSMVEMDQLLSALMVPVLLSGFAALTG